MVPAAAAATPWSRHAAPFDGTLASRVPAACGLGYTPGGICLLARLQVVPVPTYEYRCNVCGHQFERTQRMSDDPVRECDVCGGEVARVLFAPAIHFKGTGFHNTDYPSRRRG